MAVMRRPVVIGGSVVALLIVLGLPFLHVQLGLPDDRVLPTEASSRQVQDEIRTNFTSNEAGAVQVVATGTGDPHDPAARPSPPTPPTFPPGGRRPGSTPCTGSYIGGAQVAPPNEASARFASADGTWFSVVPVGRAPLRPTARPWCTTSAPSPPPSPVEVAGPSAALVDSKAAILGRLPLAAGIIAVITFVVLFLMFGSVLVPLKAIVLNLLSLTRHLRRHGVDLPGRPPGRACSTSPPPATSPSPPRS